MCPDESRRTTGWLALLLVALVLAVYAPATRFDFVNLDDPEYVTANPAMQDGLSREGIRWVFTSIHVGNWHPLTGLSLLLDNQIHGLNPHGYHLTSLLLHACNAALLFLLLRFMTGALWRSAAAAALFAVHPLHVESVAWIAIRKDPLSLLFGLLALHAYARYARRPRFLHLMAALAAYAAALMAKPMLVSLPILMLLLDAWPLRRPGTERLSGWGPLLLEKIPFAVLAAATCVITLVVQQKSGAVKTLDQFPLDTRLANALVSAATYLVRAVWPARLACYYPYPAHVALGRAALSAAALLAVTLAAAAQRRRRPCLAVGWLWFLAALLPVIGLVQVGRQALADRYAYLPLIGIYIMAAWGWAGLAGRLARGGRARTRLARAARGAVLAAPCVAIALLAVVARQQLMTWQDSTALFTRALSVTRDNDFILNNYGDILYQQGRLPEAEAALSEAVRINPLYAKALHNLGAIQSALGKPLEAVHHLEAALRSDPWFFEALTKLADLYARLGRTEESIGLYQRALALRPTSLDARNNLGVIFMDAGRHDEARSQLRAGLALEPDSGTLRYNLALNELHAGRPGEALHQYELALRLYPKAVPTLRALLPRLLACPDLTPAQRDAVLRLTETDAAR